MVTTDRAPSTPSGAAGATTRIFLARHASPHNPDGVFYGHLPGFGLSEAGRAEATALGRLLAPEPIRRIYTSPLQRAQETAALAAAELPGQPSIEVREDLIETRMGIYIQGVRRPEVLIRRPLFLIHLLRPGRLSIDEPVAAMAERVERICVEAREVCRGEAALLVSHADPIKAVWNRALGRADWRLHGLRVPKASFLELMYEGDVLASITPHPRPATPKMIESLSVKR